MYPSNDNHTALVPASAITTALTNGSTNNSVGRVRLSSAFVDGLALTQSAPGEVTTVQGTPVPTNGRILSSS